MEDCVRVSNVEWKVVEDEAGVKKKKAKYVSVCGCGWRCGG